MRIIRRAPLAAVLTLGGLAFGGETNNVQDAYKVQRQEVFEFTEKPKVIMESGQVAITFAT